MPGFRSEGLLSRRERLARAVYSAAWWLAVPLVIVYLLWRSRRQPDYRRHWGERFGFGPRVEPGQPRPIWIHAVSVGETAAAVPLIRRLAEQFPDAPILLTHGTPTGRQTGELRLKELGGRLRQAYLPYDLAGAVDRFFHLRKPRIGLIMETEVWPNLMAAARRHGVPVASINARLSARSLARGLRHAALIRPAMAAFARIVAQTPADAQRIARLGRVADAVAGNLKFDQPVSFDAQRRGLAWRRRLGVRPVVLAASTREGEEALILGAWRRQLPALAGDPAGTGEAAPLLIIVPRHPNRFDAVATLITAAALPGGMARRAALDDATADLGSVACLLGDSMGEMQSWYAAADVTIMGGSLLPFGSQNLIEANALGCPVVLGPSFYNFEQAARESIERGASLPVGDAEHAVSEALALAADGERRQAMAAAALDFAAAHRGATERTLLALAPMLRANPPVADAPPPLEKGASRAR